MVRPRKATSIPIGFRLQPDTPLDDKLIKFINSLPANKAISKTDWYKAIFQLAMDIYEINPDFLKKYLNSNEESALNNTQISFLTMFQNVC